jgi:hypothetical protein
LKHKFIFNLGAFFMKSKIILMTALSFLMALAISAQDTAKPADTPKPADTVKTTDFSGKWVLDKSKSKIEERQRIEAMTITVSQSSKELKTESETKRTPPPDGMTPGGGRGGIGGGMMAGMGPEKHSYSLEGKETTEDANAGGMPMSSRLKAEAKSDGTLGLSMVRKMSGPMGEFELTTKEVWSLSADGKTLTIVRDQTTPRGSFSNTFVLNKN